MLRALDCPAFGYSISPTHPCVIPPFTPTGVLVLIPPRLCDARRRPSLIAARWELINTLARGPAFTSLNPIQQGLESAGSENAGKRTRNVAL